MGAYTPYSTANASFSNLAHQAARECVYPHIFPKSTIEFTDTLLGTSERNRILDGEMGVDRIVHVETPPLKMPLDYMIQERFRDPKYQKYHDITITEWNERTNLPSELYKIKAGIFLYGYYDRYLNSFPEVIAINTTDLLYCISTDQIRFTRRNNPRSDQSFVTFKFEDLIRLNIAIYHSKNNSPAVVCSMLLDV